MFIAALLLSFSLNIINHRNIIIGIFNTLLLFFSIFFYYKFSHQKLSFFKFLSLGSPLIILIGAIPLFIRANSIFIIFVTIGIILLTLLYLSAKQKKVLLLMVVIYLILASFFAGGLIKPPFSFQTNLLIFKDDWTNLYITQMKTESQYMPHIICEVVFNPLVHVYVILSKVAGLYTLKNLYNALLIANIYPLIVGVTSGLKNKNRSEIFPFFCILLISLSVMFSRSEEINNTFLLLSPFLIYFILRAINSINKKIYFVLFLVSMVIATSP
jgi:hypothetical protein